MGLSRTISKALSKTKSVPVPPPSMSEILKKQIIESAGKAIPYAGITTAAMTIPYVANAISDSIKDSNLNEALEESYEKMFEEAPQLQELKEDGHEDMVRKKFEILKAYAPNVAANPILAASFVDSAMAGLGPAHAQTLKNYMELENMHHNIRKPDRSFAETAGKAIGKF